MGTALPGLGHTQPADTPRVLIYFSALFCILLPLLFCLYYPIQFQKLTHGLGLERGVCLSPSCVSAAVLWPRQPAQPQLQVQLVVFTPAKNPSLPGTTHLLPQLRLLHLTSSEPAWAPEEEKGIIPVSQAGREALGEAGSWVPALWEIRLYKQNLGDFILQRRDRSLEPAVRSLISSWKAHMGCLWDLQPTKGTKMSNLTIPTLTGK